MKKKNNRKKKNKKERESTTSFRSDKAYEITSIIRSKLKAPFGELIPDATVDEGLLRSKLFPEGAKVRRIIVSIGDRTTKRLSELHIPKDLEIVDGRERRRSVLRKSKPQVLGSSEPSLEVMRAENPPGSITAESLRALARALFLIKEKPRTRVRIEIKGEEDLLALPVLAFFPRETVLLYGQPLEGIVIVKTSGKYRKLAREISAGMGITSIG